MSDSIGEKVKRWRELAHEVLAQRHPGAELVIVGLSAALVNAAAECERLLKLIDDPDKWYGVKMYANADVACKAALAQIMRYEAALKDIASESHSEWRNERSITCPVETALKALAAP